MHYLISLDNGCPLYMGRRLLHHHPKILLLSPHYNSPKETKRKQNKHLHLFLLFIIYTRPFKSYYTVNFIKVKVVIPQLLFLQCHPLPYCSIPALHGFLANSTLTTEQKKINKYDFSHRER